MDWEVFFVLDVEAAIKLAAKGASRKTKSRGPRSREAPGRRLGKWTAAGRAASVYLGLLNLVFLEAALAGDFITAFIFLHVPIAGNPFLDPAV